MVKLNKIYTRTGDDGTTGLGTGARVLKTDTRVAAYGETDEANAVLGVAVVHATDADPRMSTLLRDIQNDLFDVGADLCIPITADEKPETSLRITQAQVDRLEALIDSYNDNLSPLTSFVLPGGSPLAAALHLARTVTRRAERATVALLIEQPESTNPIAAAYLNRLSDLLFVLGRIANNNGSGDVLWTPGANRDQKSTGPDPE